MSRPVIHNRDHRRGGADAMNGRWYNVGDADAAPFENSWTNAGGSLGVARYAINDDELTIHGAVTGGTSGTVVFTLPVTHRPAADFVKTGALTNGDALAAISVASDGTVTLFDIFTIVTGDAGADGADGSVWREGTGAPSGGLGVNGDFYLDDATGDVYLKASGSYSVVANIKGSTGASGSAGSNGAAGAAGSVWREGTGAPSSGLGANGDFYLDDATGDVYLKAAGSYSVVANILGPSGGPQGDPGPGTLMPPEQRSTNAMLAAADLGKMIYATAAFTQTLDDAATLGDGWFVEIMNDTSNGTSLLVVEPDGAETVDGLTNMTMYSGEHRRIICDGTEFFTVLIQGGFAKFTAGGNFIVPAGIVTATVDVIAGGGGGGGGRGGAAASTRNGGSSGGGGARSIRDLLAAVLGAAGTSISVTIGTGGTGGAGGSSANGSVGNAGGTSSFGSLVAAFGGGPGAGAGTSGSQNTSGGGGGGVSEVGGAGGLNQAVRGGSNPTESAAGTGGAGGGALTSGNTVANRCAEYGGGAGGGSSFSGATGSGGGGSVYGGAGGGGGGGVTTGNVDGVGATGGTTGMNAWALGGGGAAGAVNGGAGGAGADGDESACGQGGGGGGGNDAGTGGAGGAGGAVGGGGGGGGGGTTTGGAGGAGGRGECRVWYG